MEKTITNINKFHFSADIISSSFASTTHKHSAFLRFRCFFLSSIKMSADPLAKILWNSFLAEEDNSVLGSLPDSIPHWS